MVIYPQEIKRKSQGEGIMHKEFYESMKKAKALVGQMTITEKVAQLSMYAPGTAGNNTYNPKVKDDGSDADYYGGVGAFLCYSGKKQIKEIQDKVLRDNPKGVPAFFANDVVHGDLTTMPTPLAQSCSWEPEITRECCEVAAREAYNNGTRWTFAPMVDIARDPRWGRIVEGFGEDPLLCSDFAAASVKGFQGDELGKPGHVMACMKHFAGYGACEGGRDYAAAELSEQMLRDVYLPSFKAGLDAGAATFMASFNTINGVPSSGNKKLLSDILRDEWGFEGFVVSDYNGITEMINHGFAEDEKDAVCKAFNAGLDMVMVGNAYNNYLPELVEEGKVSEEKITHSAEIVVAFKYLLGLMDDPEINEDMSMYLCPEHRAVALKAAENCIVLLENNGILPLKPETCSGKTIAVVGPIADDREEVLGSWAGRDDEQYTVSVLDAIKEVYGEYATVNYKRGVDFVKDEPFDQSAVDMAEKADIIIAVMGEPRWITGEAASQSVIDVKGRQNDFIRALRATGKPIITLFSGGRPTILNDMKESSDALMLIWQGGTEAGHAAVNVLMGKHNPSGRLTTSFPAHCGQIPVNYNHLRTGRPALGENHQGYVSRYRDIPLYPLYTFGYGLSYTDFEYSDMCLSADSMKANGSIKVSVKVRNAGKYAGHDVVQLYIRDIAASICQPVKELKGYKKIYLEAGEVRTVTFDLSAQSLAFTNAEMKKVVEPGKFYVWVAHNSLDDALQAEFTVEE